MTKAANTEQSTEVTSNNQGDTAVAEKPATTASKNRTASKGTGNFFEDTANKVFNLNRPRALAAAEVAAKAVEDNYFQLGGLLKRINTESWFEPEYEDFATYVEEKFGFGVRKAQYLQDIYTQLTFNRIPFEKVAGLGWTKIKELAAILDVTNVDEWVEKASRCTVAELKKLIKGEKVGSDDEGGEGSTGTKSDTKRFSVVLKNDQIDVVTSAVARAKGELETEYDNVALENICAQYLGTAPVAVNLSGELQKMGLTSALALLKQAYPDLDLDLDLGDAPAAEIAEAGQDAEAGQTTEVAEA